MFAMYWHLESLSRWPLNGWAMGCLYPNQGARKGAGIQCTVDLDRRRSRHQECNAEQARGARSGAYHRSRRGRAVAARVQVIDGQLPCRPHRNQA